MCPPAVRLAGVCKSYISAGATTPVLEGVDLAIEVGQKASLIGPSGSGKSTLLALIAGLLRPDEGSVEIDGVALAMLDDSERAGLRARQIGIALQSDNLISFLTAEENVALAMGFGGQPSGVRQARALLDRMGVGDRARHFPRQLSGGEAQRVALSVALANAPRLLLADEMVAQLDATTAESVVGDIFGTDMAVLFVTHDIALADRAEVRMRVEGRRIVTR